VDTASFADVLLESLAAGPHAPKRADPTWRPASPSDPSRAESERPLAHGQNHCHGCRSDERLADAPAQLVTERQELSGDASLPGFRVVLGDLFR
jgi:hypothetical protein